MLNTRKKISCFLLAAAMTASLFGGCTSSATSSASGDESTAPAASGAESAATPGGDGNVTEMTFWDFHEKDELTFFQNAVDEYNAANADVQIKLVTMTSDDYRGTKMATAFASGTGPDIFEVFPGSFLKYANAGVLAPLNDAISDEVLADFSPSSIEAVTVNDEILAIPFEIELLGVYYDVDALAEAGVEPPKTWNELKDAAAKLTTDTRSGYSMHVTKGGHQLFEWYPFLWQVGGSIYNEDGTAAALNQPGIIENLKLKRELFETGSANVKPSRDNTDIGILGDGEAAIQLNGSWAISGLERDYPDKNVKVIPIPVAEGGSPASVAGGWKMCANKTSPNADKAVEFVTWMFAGDDNSRMVDWCTSVKFAHPPRQSVIESMEEIFNKGLRAAFTNEIYGTEQAEMRLPPEISAILEDMLQACYFDTSVSVEDEILKAEEKINEFLATYDGAL